MLCIRPIKAPFNWGHPWCSWSIIDRQGLLQVCMCICVCVCVRACACWKICRWPAVCLHLQEAQAFGQLEPKMSLSLVLSARWIPKAALFVHHRPWWLSHQGPIRVFFITSDGTKSHWGACSRTLISPGLWLFPEDRGLPVSGYCPTHQLDPQTKWSTSACKCLLLADYPQTELSLGQRQMVTVPRFCMLDLWLEACQEAGDMDLPSWDLTTRLHGIWGGGRGLLGCSSWLQRERRPKAIGMIAMWGETRQMGAGSWDLNALLMGPLIL